MSNFDPSQQATCHVHDFEMLVNTGLTNALCRILADEPGTTALSYAVMRGDGDLTRLLLKYGADPRIKNDEG